MKIEFLLHGSKAYSWYRQNNILFLGYFFHGQELYRGDEAIDFLINQLEKKDIKDIAKKLNGCFSIIIRQDSQLKVVSDSLNFFPVFFTKHDDSWLISDFFETLIEKTKNFEINTVALPEFETAGFVLNNETLGQNIFKNNANEVVYIEEKDFFFERYKYFITKYFSEKNYAELSRDSEIVLMNIAEKLLKFLNGRTAVIPLSGGYDSRLIASLLKKMDYKNVICFTFGKYNPEVPISKKVAEHLHYDWHFVDFTKIDLQKYKKEKLYEAYLEKAGNGYSMPYLMEYFAIRELQDQNILPQNSVFIPGHSGDFLGGSYILKTVKKQIKKEMLPKWVENNYFFFIKKNNGYKGKIQERISKSLKIVSSEQNDYHMEVEDWDIQEKLAKFIFHSSFVYHFFGYEHYFPLWDKELVDFYRTVPYQYRENKNLYDKVAIEEFFMPLGIHFKEEELKISSFKRNFQKLKDNARYFFPWKMVLQRINNADWPYYQLLTKDMKKQIEDKNGRAFENFKNYNAVICAWYIQYLHEKHHHLSKKGT